MSAFAIGLAFFIPGLDANAANETNKFFKERINGVEFEIPYKKSEVFTEKESEGLIGKIKVYDKRTNELLEIFQVEDEIDLENINPQNSGEFSTLSSGTYLQNVSRTRFDNGLETRLRARIEIYYYNSFRQINRVLSTGWFTGSGNHTIENATADSIPVGDGYPSSGIQVLGDATIQIATTQEFSAGWEAAGFSVGGTVGGENYYRKYIEMGFTHSLY